MKAIRIVVALVAIGVAAITSAQSNCTTRCTDTGSGRRCTITCYDRNGNATICTETCRFDGYQTRCSSTCY